MEHPPESEPTPSESQQTVPETGEPTSLPAKGRVRDPGSPGIAALCWVGVVLVLTGMFALATLLAPSAEQLASQEESQVPQTSPMFEATAKLAVASGTEAERDQVLTMLPWFTTTKADRARAALVIADQRSLDDGLERLDKIAETAEGQLAQDVESMHTMLTQGPSALSEADLDAMEQRHGYAWRLALTGQLDPEDPARKAVVAEARRSYMVQAGFTLGLIGLGVLAVLLSILTIVLLAVRAIKRRYAPAAPGGSVFLEAFLIFLVALPLSEILMVLLEPLIGPYALLSRWVLLVPALWPVVRGSPATNTRYALGWHTGKGVFREMFAGAVGYLALLPIAAIGIFITLALAGIVGLFAEPDAEGSPVPVHPLGDMLGQAGTIELILLVQLAVVWAPVVEETLFRGALYHHLRARVNPIVGGLIVGVIFAALHPQGLIGIPALTNIGLIFCLLREWRGSIIAPITAHALNNGFITLMMIMLISA